MSDVFSLNGMALPDIIRTNLANHLAHLGRATDVLVLQLALERAEGFLEDIQAARALTPATVEGLFIALDVAASMRRRELAP